MEDTSGTICEVTLLPGWSPRPGTPGDQDTTVWEVCRVLFPVSKIKSNFRVTDDFIRDVIEKTARQGRVCYDKPVHKLAADGYF